MTWIVGTSLILNTGFGTQLETVEGWIAGVVLLNRTSWLFRNSSSSDRCPRPDNQCV